MDVPISIIIPPIICICDIFSLNKNIPNNAVINIPIGFIIGATELTFTVCIKLRNIILGAIEKNADIKLIIISFLDILFNLSIVNSL